MSAKSNLQLARKYEWYAMLAKNSNNKADQDRYESMAKLALLDAGIQYQTESNEDKTFHYACSNDPSVRKHPVVYVVAGVITAVFLSFVYYFGSLL